MEAKGISKEDKKMVNSRVLFGIRSMEEQLARQDSKKLEESFPPGHPMIAEIEKRVITQRIYISEAIVQIDNEYNPNTLD